MINRQIDLHWYSLQRASDMPKLRQETGFMPLSPADCFKVRNDVFLMQTCERSITFKVKKQGLPRNILQIALIFADDVSVGHLTHD